MLLPRNKNGFNCIQHVGSGYLDWSFEKKFKISVTLLSTKHLFSGWHGAEAYRI